MHFCRICRTEKNLKFTVNEVRQNKKRSDERLLRSTSRLGNICHTCDERIRKFNQDESEEGDGREERIIVDDDELLYNMYFEKMGRIIGNGGEWQQTLVTPTAAINTKANEVIEVLTSRENSTSPVPELQKSVSINRNAVATQVALPNKPTATTQSNSKKKKATSKSDLKKSTQYDDFDVIDLLSDGEASTKGAVEESVVTDVGAEISPKISGNTKSLRRQLSSAKMRLIASFSLLSSDDCNSNDSAETDAIQNISESINGNIANSVCENSGESPLKCNHCELSIQSMDELKIHECLKTGVKCPVCEVDFAVSQRLIHHMRCKHRSYDGNVLSERPRCSQDSAMTIRLRYRQRYTYYECQLCGRIDSVFKEHKQHVMQLHAAESRSLRDPMMQELKCALCKEKCGTHFTVLCRHLLRIHTNEEYNSYMREITNLRAVFKYSTNKLKELRRSARVFQFNKRKSLYIECRQCQNVVVGYNKHLKHLRTHDNVNSKQIAENNVPKYRKKTKTKNSIENEEKGTAEITREPDVPKKVFNTKQTQQIESAKIPKQRKLSKKAAQAAVVKVKVKPPMRRLPTQKYKCPLCPEIFLGFCQLNLHYLSVHNKIDENVYCSRCQQSFINQSEFNKHSEMHLCQRKRKFKHDNQSGSHGNNVFSNYSQNDLEGSNKEATSVVTKETTTTISLNRQTENMPQGFIKNEDTANNKTLTLREQHKNGPDTEELPISAQPCEYCAHLFATAEELRAHEVEHIQQQHVKMLHYTPFNNATPAKTIEMNDLQSSP